MSLETSMRLPRWIVIGLLVTSLLAVVASASWWWVTWPERTAREFHDLLVQQRWDEARAMSHYSGVDYPPDAVVAWLAAGRPQEFADESRLEQQTLTWSDLCRGRRQFRLGV